MRDDAANAEVEHARSADAPRPQRVEAAAVVGKAPSLKAEPRAADGGPSAVRRRWKRILIAFCAAVALLFALPKLLDRQPRYQGRTVESWLAQSYDPNRNQSEAVTALEAMGREAVPYEIKALSRHDLMWRQLLRQIRAKAPTFVAEMLPRSEQPDLLRIAALQALVNNQHTKDFAPDIVRLLDDTDPKVRLGAAHVVAHIAKSLDRSAIPAIRRVLDDPDPTIRSCSALALAAMGSTAEEAWPDLERALIGLLRFYGTNPSDRVTIQLVNQIQFEQRRISHVPNR